MNVLNLNGDVCVGISPVEDSSKVKLRVSLLLEHPGPYGVVLASHNGINIWSCEQRKNRSIGCQERCKQAPFLQSSKCTFIL